MALYAFDGTSKEADIDHEQDANVVRFARGSRGRRVYLPGVGRRFGTPGAVLVGWIGFGLHHWRVSATRGWFSLQRIA